MKEVFPEQMLDYNSLKITYFTGKPNHSKLVGCQSSCALFSLNFPMKSLLKLNKEFLIGCEFSLLSGANTLRPVGSVEYLQVIL